MSKQLPLPQHYDPAKVSEVWRVPYQDRFYDALQWAEKHELKPASTDDFRIGLILIDVQNTFAIPNFELFVAGRSGSGAVDDNRRLCEFIYKNMHLVNEISPTMDTHRTMQIFHSIFLVDEAGNHPTPYSIITVDDIEAGRWLVNPDLPPSLGIDPDSANAHLRYYGRTLAERGKFNLTIWPYHAMLGGIGHALVSSVEEAIFFHSIARNSQPDFQIKGDSPLTEHYSALRSEVMNDQFGMEIGSRNEKFIEKIEKFDIVIITGQAKSHCVAFTLSDLLADIQDIDETLARKVYLLEDCTSPVVIEGVVDYTEQAEAAFQRFSSAGMHIVKSSEPIESWPGVERTFNSD
jgi:nicotinamidase-related amidase